MDAENEASKIESILDNILPQRDLNLVTLKSVRKDVADQLNVEESYFSENKEKKDLLKTILKEKILKLYNLQKIEVEDKNKKPKKESVNKIASKSNVKKKKVIKSSSDSDNEKNESSIEEEYTDDEASSNNSVKLKKKKQQNFDNNTQTKKKRKEIVESDDDLPKKKKKKA